jgi:hypothetical protein
MGQMTIRTDDEVIEMAKQRARELGLSLNQFVSNAVHAAVDPDLEGDEAERLRARFRAAGILAEGQVIPSGPRPTKAEFMRAQREAGKGKPLSELIEEERRTRW